MAEHSPLHDLVQAPDADLSRGEYVERMATKLEHDASVYRMLSHAFFLVGVLAAAVMLLAHAVS